jgi:hypothetical protein
MEDILDIKDPKVIEKIIKKYSIQVGDAEEKVTKAVESLKSRIEYSRTHTEEEIYAAIEKKTKEEYVEMDNNKALRSAIIKEFAKKSSKKLPEEAIENAIKKMTDERKRQLIIRYKNAWYKEAMNQRTKEVETHYPIYSCLNEKEMEEYIELYAENYLKGLLFHAREDAIKETADELGVKPPLCITNMKAVDAVSNRIIKTEDQDEQDKIKAGGLRERFKRLSLAVRKTAVPTLAEIGVCQIIVPFVGYMAHSVYNKSDVTAGVVIASEAIIVAGAVISFQSENIRGYFKDKETVEEAKKLGILDLLVNWGKAWMKLDEYEAKLNTKYCSIDEIVEGGNKNGLH